MRFINYDIIIRKGMEEKEGTKSAHREKGVPYVDKVHEGRNLPTKNSMSALTSRNILGVCRRIARVFRTSVVCKLSSNNYQKSITLDH